MALATRELSSDQARVGGRAGLQECPASCSRGPGSGALRGSCGGEVLLQLEAVGQGPTGRSQRR